MQQRCLVHARHHSTTMQTCTCPTSICICPTSIVGTCPLSTLVFSWGLCKIVSFEPSTLNPQTLIRLARASPLTQRRVYRGSTRMKLPRQFAVKDQLGHQCIVEMGFMSTSTKKEVALDYAAGGS